MAKVFTNETNLHNIGDAIREKNESETTYKPSEMAAAILALPTYPEPTGTKAISSNGTHDVKDYAYANVDVPNSYAAGDEGKVVDNGALVSQTSTTKNANGTYDTTTNNEVVVNVPNTYGSSDEGKVVSNGSLVAQSSQNINQNGTYDTTLKNEVIVDVSGGGGHSDLFIESQGSNYVNTGIAGNSVYGMYLEFTPITTVNNYQWYCGAANNNLTIASMSASDGVTSGFIRCGNIDFGVVSFLRGQKNVLEIKNGKVKLNGTELSGTFTGAINSTSETIKLFGSSSSSSYSHCRIYECILYDENDDVLHDYVPNIDSNNIPCIYDNTTQNTVYGNNNRLTVGYKQ